MYTPFFPVHLISHDLQREQKEKAPQKKKKETYIFVHKSGIRSFPRRNAPSTVPQRNKTRLNPSRSKSIEEIRLARNFVFVEIGITQFTYVDLIHH